MNATSLAHTSYAATSAPTRTAKSLEYEVVARVTRNLASAWSKRDTDFPGLVKALNENRMLWQIFATDVSSNQNKLPPSIRAELFYLAEFTFAHTRRALARKDGVADLVEINKAILRGLNTEHN